MSWSELAGTAVVVAALRAAESARPDRLVDDPYAAELVAAAGLDPARIDVFRSPDSLTGDYFGLRTRFLDDLCRAAGLDQVVLLAAGLDTRAYRLDWPPGTRLFELDTAPVLDFKADVLRARPRCERVPVAADLRADWPAALVGAGFRATRPTLWLVEGVLLYLPAAARQGVLGGVSGLSAPGSQAGVEDVGGGAIRVPLYRAMAERHGLPYPAMATDDDPRPAAADLTAAGWWVTAVTAADLAAEHGRPIPPLWDPARPASAAALGLGGHLLDTTR